MLSVATMALWLQFDNSSTLVLFCAFILIAPSNAVVILFFWGIFGRIFDFRQSKRLAGGIDTGQAIATILAFFSIPFIQPLLSSISDFIVLSAFSVLGVFFVVFIITRKFTFITTNKLQKSKSNNSEEIPAAYVRKDYIFLMSLFVTCSVLVASFVDFTFLNVASARFTEQNELADYLSFFGGTVIVASFLVQTFLNDFILEQYGLRTGLLILPIILIGFISTEIFVGNYFGFTVEEAGENFLIFFVVVSLSKLFVDALRDSLESPTVKIFFFPLDPSIRFDTQTRIEGVISQFAGFLAGLLIIGLGALKFSDLLFNNYIVLAIIVIWIYATFKIHKSYTKALKGTLSNSHTGKTSENDPVISKLLKRELNESDDNNYRLILQISEKLDYLLLENHLLNFDINTSEEKQRFCIEKIQEIHLYEAIPQLKRFISEGKIGNQNNLELAKNVYSNLKERNKNSSKFHKIEALANSPEVENRAEACRLIIQSFDEEKHRLLVPLIRDTNSMVRRAAIFAVGKLKIDDFLPTLISYMSLVGYENTAVSAILNYGKIALPLLETTFYKNGQRQNVQINIVQMYGMLGGHRAIQLLLKKISYPDKKVAKEALVALNHCGWTAEKGMRAIVRTFLDNVIGDTIWDKAVLIEISENPNNTYLAQALKEQLSDKNDELFLLLSILYDKESVMLVRKNLESATSDSIGYAMELLDIFVEDDLKLKLFPLLDESPIEIKLKKLDLEFPKEPFTELQALKEIINRDYNSVDNWTKICAIHSLAMHEEATICRELVANIFNPDLLIQETAVWAIAKQDLDSYYKYCERLPEAVSKRLHSVVLPAIANDDEGRLLSLEKVIFLYNIPQFKGISGVELTDCIEWMQEVEVELGADVSLRDDFGKQYLFFVVDGNIALENVNGQQIGNKNRYEMISYLLLEHNKYEHIDKLIATEKSVLYRIPDERFYEIMGDHYAFTDKFIHNLYQKKADIDQSTLVLETSNL
jgi:hypothetical protein